MRISSVSLSNSYDYGRSCKPRRVQNKAINFHGKHDCAKFLGALFAGTGTIGALGGIAIMTGGVSLIPTLIYGAACGGTGVFIGHKIDKGAREFDKNA